RRENMKCYHSVAGLVLAFAVAWGLASPVAAGDQVPLKGSVAESYTRSGIFPFFHLEPTGTGNATQLGQFSFAIPHDVNLLLTPPGGTGTFEFTGSTGDTVYGTFLTHATPTEFPGVLH